MKYVEIITGKVMMNIIGNWLQGCTILRNICAHRGRLFNRQITFSLRLGKKNKQIFKERGIFQSIRLQSSCLLILS